MKYKWIVKKYWWSWLKQDYKRLFYKFFYGWKLGGFNGTMIPSTGKGKYVSVYRKGDIIQIVDEEGVHDEIRIIPYKQNHGVMIERLKNGKMHSRYHLGIDQLNKDIIFASNIEALTNRKQ